MGTRCQNSVCTVSSGEHSTSKLLLGAALNNQTREGRLAGLRTCAAGCTLEGPLPCALNGIPAKLRPGVTRFSRDTA